MKVRTVRLPTPREPAYKTPDEAISASQAANLRKRFEAAIKPLFGSIVRDGTWNDKEVFYQLSCGNILSIKCENGDLKWHISDDEALIRPHIGFQTEVVKLRFQETTLAEFNWDRSQIMKESIGQKLSGAFASETIFYLYFGDHLIVSYTILVDNVDGSNIIYWAVTD